MITISPLPPRGPRRSLMPPTTWSSQWRTVESPLTVWACNCTSRRTIMVNSGFKVLRTMSRGTRISILRSISQRLMSSRQTIIKWGRLRCTRISWISACNSAIASPLRLGVTQISTRGWDKVSIPWSSTRVSTRRSPMTLCWLLWASHQPIKRGCLTELIVRAMWLNRGQKFLDLISFTR